MATADPDPLRKLIKDYTAAGAIKEPARSRFYAALAPVVFKYSSRTGNSVDAALMVISQARTEQGFSGPVSQDYRVFNTQLTWSQMNALLECRKKPAAEQDACCMKKIPELNDPEVWYAWMDSAEIDNDGKRVVRKSPFFIFSSLDASVRFYFERLASKYAFAATALNTVSNGKGTVDTFGNALDHVKYSTNPKYGLEVIKIYKETLPDFKAILSNEIANATADAQTLPEDLTNLQKCLNSLP